MQVHATFRSRASDAAPDAGAFDRLSGLAFGQDGTLYVVEEGNNRILELQLPPLQG